MSFRQCHRQHCRMIKLRHDRDYIEDARQAGLAPNAVDCGLSCGLGSRR
jgi:hypothetical protein